MTGESVVGCTCAIAWSEPVSTHEHRTHEDRPDAGLPQLRLPRPNLGRPLPFAAEDPARERAAVAWRTTPGRTPYARPGIVPSAAVAAPTPLVQPQRVEAPPAHQHQHPQPSAHYRPPIAQSSLQPPSLAQSMQVQPYDAQPAHAPAWTQPAAARPAYAQPAYAQPAYALPAVAQPAHAVAVQHRPAAAPAQPPRPTPAAATPAASVAWRADDRGTGTLAWFTPIHAGAILCIVLVAWIVTHGPQANFRAGTPSALPAIAGAPSAGGPATSQTLPLKAKPQGMPSASSAASLAISHGDIADARAIDRHLHAPMRMQGIPSPAAAETMAPKTLPLLPTDGMTLPRVGDQRDDHAVSQHYGDVPADTPSADVSLPVTTPGQSAAIAESQRQPVVVGTDDYTPTTTGMYSTQ